MSITFLLKCFLIGVLAASGCGPVFVLTFNRSAICGFWRGLATALGASLGDGTYFLLGLLGALSVISEIKYFMVFLYLIGGLVLIALGIHSLRQMRQVFCVTVECSYRPVLAIGKAFTLTVLNPLIILFFIAVTMHILPHDVAKISIGFVVSSVFAVWFGSMFVLSSVSLVASYLGSCITTRQLQVVSGITGMVFIGFGLYLISNFGLQIIKIV